MFKLWPASGPASYDSAASAITQGPWPCSPLRPSHRPAGQSGCRIGHSLIFATTRARPTILVSLGNPYLIGHLPEVGSYLIGWRSNSVTEQAVAAPWPALHPSPAGSRSRSRRPTPGAGACSGNPVNGARLALVLLLAACVPGHPTNPRSCAAAESDWSRSRTISTRRWPEAPRPARCWA